jgi:Sulfotransferase family
VSLCDIARSAVSVGAILRSLPRVASLCGAQAANRGSSEVADANGKGRRRISPRSSFVLCPARSGSTLLRLILDGHPEIACPPETNLVEVFAKIGFTVAAAGEPSQATTQTTTLCRDVADRILGAYAQQRGKTMWVDKSLPSALFADLLAKIYPDGRFICLYRRCADMVASLHEASSWSYDSFGVLPWVAASPGNLVQALTSYWVDRVALLQAFEEAHAGLALRVRYEDLVVHPAETVARILGFLGVRCDDAVVAAALAFRPDSSTVIPGDLKVRFSRGIDSSSVGRGWSVPFDMLTEDLRDRVNDLSRGLDYPPLPNLKHYTKEAASPLISVTAPAGPHSHEMKRLLEDRIAAPAGTLSGRRNGSSSLLKLVLTDIPEPWMLDLETGQVEAGDGMADWLALTDSETLLSLVAGRVNPGVAMKNSELQIVSACDQTVPDQFLDCVDELMTLLRG